MEALNLNRYHLIGVYKCEHCDYDCIYDDPNRQRHISSKRHNIKVSKTLGISIDDAIRLSLQELHGQPQRHSFVEQHMSNMFRVERFEHARPEDLWFLDEDPGHDEPAVIDPPEPAQELVQSVPLHFQTELTQVASMMGWECAVCLESLTAERFHLTPCFHKVCRVCVSQVDRCPVCRREW